MFPKSTTALGNRGEDPATSHPGSYSSEFSPYVFSFHRVPVDKRIGSTVSSVACNDENQLLGRVVHEYIEDWQDECVGDYARCYSLEQDKSVMLAFLCRTRWDLPEGTSHIAVNCTRDRALFKKLHAHLKTREANEFKEYSRELVKEVEIIGCSVLTFLTLMRLVCCVCAYRWVLRPYTDAIEAVSSSEGEKLLGDSGY